MPGPATILLVEDDFDVRQLIRTYLAEQDYTVIEADNADAAMAVLTSGEAIDLLLTDIVMPGARDGFALAREARRLFPAIKVLHVTGFSDRVGPERDIANAEMLQKPFKKSELVERVGNLLGRWAVDRNPVLRRVYEYWRDKRGGRRAPDRRDLDPAEIAEVLPYLSIVEIAPAGSGHRFRLVGTRVVEALGYDPTNRFVEDFVEIGNGDFTIRLLREVARTAQPVYFASSFRSSTTGLATERVLLPLTRGGKAIRQVVIAQTFDWRTRKRTIHELTQEQTERSDTIERPPTAEDHRPPPRHRT